MYYIRERWLVMHVVETYDEKSHPVSNKVKNLKDVKAWIKGWIEAWKENAINSGDRVTSIKTDYKTFAELRIRKDFGVDAFKLKVVNPAKKKQEIYEWRAKKNGGD